MNNKHTPVSKIIHNVITFLPEQHLAQKWETKVEREINLYSYLSVDISLLEIKEPMPLHILHSIKNILPIKITSNPTHVPGNFYSPDHITSHCLPTSLFRVKLAYKQDLFQKVNLDVLCLVSSFELKLYHFYSKKGLRRSKEPSWLPSRNFCLIVLYKASCLLISFFLSLV